MLSKNVVQLQVIAMIRLLTATGNSLTFNDNFPEGGAGAVTPYNGLYREAPPERGTVFRLQIYERVGKSVILVCKKAEKG